MGSQQPVLNGKDRDFQSCGLEDGDSSPKPITTFIGQACELLLRAGG